MKTIGSRPDPRISVASTSKRSHKKDTVSRLRINRAIPQCTRCLAHGKSFPVKGHKPHCKHRNCVCDTCVVAEKASWYRAKLLAKMRSIKNKKASETAETDSNAVAGSLPFRSFLCNSAQSLSTSRAPNASYNISPLPQSQHQLTRRCQQCFENRTPLNTADTIVEERVLPSISGITQPDVSSDSLSSSGTTSDRNYPGTYINIDWSTTKRPQQNQQCPLGCSHSFTNYEAQPDNTTPMTNLLSMIDWSSSLSSSTSNTTVPNVPSSTNPSPNTKTQYHLRSKAEAPSTDFRSIDSLSLSSTSENSRTPPVTSSDWTNVALTTIPPRQTVMQQPERSCGNCEALAQWESLFYGSLKLQYPLYYQHINRS